MESDIHIVKIKLEDDFGKVIKETCKLQASREEPRKLVTMFEYKEDLVLIFELANQEGE